MRWDVPAREAPSSAVERRALLAGLWSLTKRLAHRSMWPLPAQVRTSWSLPHSDPRRHPMHQREVPYIGGVCFADCELRKGAQRGWAIQQNRKEVFPLSQGQVIISQKGTRSVHHPV